MKLFDTVNQSPWAVNKVTLYANIITLSGSTTDGHTANITINGFVNKTIVTVSGSSLTTTAIAWCLANYDYYKAKGFLVTSSGAVITVVSAYGWQTTNNINATIATVTGTLTGTYTGTFTLDGSKAKIWEVTFTTASVVFAAPVGMKDGSTAKVVFISTTTTSVTTSSLVYINGTSAVTFTVDTTAPYILDVFYDSVTKRLVGFSSESIIDNRRIALNGTAPVNAVAAAGLLTLTGTVLDGETITIGSQVFEIDNNSAVSGTNVAIDVSSYTVKAKGTLTVTGASPQIADGFTITLGTKTYTFKNTLTATEGQIKIGASDTATLVNAVSALNHTGTPGTDYYCAAAHPTVFGFSSDATHLIVQARNPGVAGNSIVSTKSGSPIAWDNTTLGTTTAGVDCTAANAKTALIAQITSGSTVVAATAGTGTTVLITLLIKGAAGNSVVPFSTTLTHGSVDAATLGTAVAGVNGTVGQAFELRADATNIYMAIAANTIVDANWRKLVMQTI